MAKIGNFVGGHDIVIYQGAWLDTTIRKYRGGVPVAIIPFAGKMLSAKVSQAAADPINIDGVEIATRTAQQFTSVDPLPKGYDYYIVSAMYVAACRAVGVSTDHLLTIDGTVVDDNGRVIGCTGFNRN